MMRCHNCKAAISKGHELAKDARFYHLDCFPRESTATIGVAQIQNHAAEIEALQAEVNEAKSLLREWIRDPRRLREAYIMSETATRTSRFLRIKKDDNHD